MEPSTARELGEACIWRLRDLVVDALRTNRLEAEADRLVRTTDLDELQGDAASERSDGDDAVNSGLAYLRDTVELSRGGRPDACRGETADAGHGAIAANLTYVSAVAAGAFAAKRTDDPTAFAAAFDRERDWQRQWIRDRLALTEPAMAPGSA